MTVRTTVKLRVLSALTMLAAFAVAASEIDAQALDADDAKAIALGAPVSGAPAAEILPMLRWHWLLTDKPSIGEVN